MGFQNIVIQYSSVTFPSINSGFTIRFARNPAKLIHFFWILRCHPNDESVAASATNIICKFSLRKNVIFITKTNIFQIICRILCNRLRHNLAELFFPSINKFTMKHSYPNSRSTVELKKVEHDVTNNKITLLSRHIWIWRMYILSGNTSGYYLTNLIP